MSNQEDTSLNSQLEAPLLPKLTKEEEKDLSEYRKLYVGAGNARNIWR